MRISDWSSDVCSSDLGTWTCIAEDERLRLRTQRPINGTMQDLNDLHYFVRVVDHGGFAPAARATGLQKSKLSRRIAALESRLGVRLLYRSSRRFSVAEVGQDFYRHCVAMLVEGEAAEHDIGREPCRDRACQSGSLPGGDVATKNT